MQAEAKKQTSLGRAIEQELEFLRSNAKGQQKKGKARMRRYDELVDQVGIGRLQFATVHTPPQWACSQGLSIELPTAPQRGARLLSTLGSRRWTASRYLQGLGWARRWCR